MPNDKKTDFEAKKNDLLKRREANIQNKENLKKLFLSFGAISILSSGLVLETDATNKKNNQKTSKKPEKATIYDVAKDTISAGKRLEEGTSHFEDFDKVIEDMDNTFNNRFKKMEQEFNVQSKEMDNDFEKTTQNPTEEKQSIIMRGGLIVNIEDQDGNTVPFKKDIENDYTTRNVLDKIIREKMNIDNNYAQSSVMEDVAKMVYDLNNNIAEFDKEINRQMKGIKPKTEKDGSVSFLYINKDGKNYELANFSKETAENNPALKRIRENEAIAQKNIEQNQSRK